MKKTMVAVALSFISVAFITPTTNWKVVPDTKVKFAINGMLGIDVNGTFDIVRSAIQFNANALPASSIFATVSVNSLKTSNSKRDAHLKTADYFDAATYPEIIFKSVSIEKIKSNTFMVTGNLTIKKITKQISIPFAFMQNTGEAVFSGTFNIKRLDYGIGSKSVMLGNQVDIRLNIPVKI